MAKDVKTQKKNVKKEENKKILRKEKEEVVAKVVNTKKVKKEKKKMNERLVSTGKVLENNRKAILFGLVGFLVATLLFRFILWPDRIATLSDGTQPVANINGEAYTADKLYEEMKEHYSVNLLLNDIDDMLLSEMYPEDNDMKNEIKDSAEYYYSYYETYQSMTKEQFLSYYGFKNEEAFLESLKLDHRRNKYYEDYVESLITDEEINEYYKDEVYGDVDSKHILVKVAKNEEEGLSNADAKKLAQEIIKKLNDGKTWDEVIEEYKDKITTEELGYNAYNASFEAPYLEECKKLEVGKYSKTPVETSYGYHIIYKIDQKEKPTLDEVKDDIIDTLASEKKNADNKLYYKSLILMREEAKLEFVDTKLGDSYKDIVNQYK